MCLPYFKTNKKSVYHLFASFIIHSFLFGYAWYTLLRRELVVIQSTCLSYVLHLLTATAADFEHTSGGHFIHHRSQVITLIITSKLLLQQLCWTVFKIVQSRISWIFFCVRIVLLYQI